MSQPSAPSGAVRIPPPRIVRWGALLALAEAVGVAVLAIAVVVSGLRGTAPIGRLFAQGAYYLVLAAAIAACAVALLQGRRWGRTPILVIQIVLAAVAVWMAVPNEHPVLGVALILLAVATGGLLVAPSANSWASEFPGLWSPPA